MAESKEELKSLLMKVKEESEKTDLNSTFKNRVHGIWSHHFMANRGETMETVRDFICLGSKITVDGDCSHEIKKHLLLGRKTDKLRQHIKKQRHHLAYKVPYSQSYGFSSSHVHK